jgi:hypothetical protein
MDKKDYNLGMDATKKKPGRPGRAEPTERIYLSRSAARQIRMAAAEHGRTVADMFDIHPELIFKYLMQKVDKLKDS